MDKKIIEIDFGGSAAAAAARRYQRSHGELSLGELLQRFPARFPAAERPDRQTLDLRLENILFQPVTLPSEPEGGGPETAAPENAPLAGLDRLWEAARRAFPSPFPRAGRARLKDRFPGPLFPARRFPVREAASPAER